jgi:hypothetical protein
MLLYAIHIDWNKESSAIQPVSIFFIFERANGYVRHNVQSQGRGERSSQ